MYKNNYNKTIFCYINLAKLSNMSTIPNNHYTTSPRKNNIANYHISFVKSSLSPEITQIAYPYYFSLKRLL